MIYSTIKVKMFKIEGISQLHNLSISTVKIHIPAYIIELKSILDLDPLLEHKHSEIYIKLYNN